MSKTPLTLGVIPARAHSTRFPFKVIAKIQGRPMLQYIWEAAMRSKLERVVIATDHPEVEIIARGFGAEVVMTPSDLNSGTDRAAFVARESSAETIAVLQADEPLLPHAAINSLLSVFENPDSRMATLAVKRHSFPEFRNPNVVKLAMTPSNRALYFSRAPLVYDSEGSFYKHVGIYAYRRETLLRFAGLPQSPLERAERLEQLRALESGIPIEVCTILEDTIAVDAPEDIAKVERALQLGGLGGRMGEIL